MTDANTDAEQPLISHLIELRVLCAARCNLCLCNTVDLAAFFKPDLWLHRDTINS